jgi:GTP pyrophosphokinase
LEKESQLEAEYRVRFDTVLARIAAAITAEISEYLKDEPRIDRVVARPKSVKRFLSKAATKSHDGGAKYSDPLHQIQDQVGARIIVFYPSDVPRISAIVERYFRPIEARSIVPDSEWEFGYFGKHYVLLLPSDVLAKLPDKSKAPDFFELQIKTLFQHAWSEADHDLGYKPEETPLSGDALRLLALASAQSWGADRIFDQLFLRTEEI